MAKDTKAIKKSYDDLVEKTLIFLAKSKTFNAMQMFKKIYPSLEYDAQEIGYNTTYPNNLNFVFRMAVDANDVVLMHKLVDLVLNDSNIDPDHKRTIIKSMLEQKHIASTEDDPLLTYAVMNSNKDVVDCLINMYKQHVNKNVSKFVNATNEAKVTALMFACYNNKLAIVQQLIDNEADVNACSMFGGTALFDTLYKDIFSGRVTVKEIRDKKNLLTANLEIANILCQKLENLDAKHYIYGSILKSALRYFCCTLSPYEDYSKNLLEIIAKHMHKMTAVTICDFLSTVDTEHYNNLIKMLDNDDLRKYLSFENIAKLIANHDKYSTADKLAICKSWLKLLEEISGMKQTPNNHQAIKYAREQLQQYSNMKLITIGKNGVDDNATMLETFMQYKLRSTAPRRLPAIPDSDKPKPRRLSPLVIPTKSKRKLLPIRRKYI